MSRNPLNQGPKQGGFCEYTLANDHEAMVADGVAEEGHGWLAVAWGSYGLHSQIWLP